jgi:hypothetical protein
MFIGPHNFTGCIWWLLLNSSLGMYLYTLHYNWILNCKKEWKRIGGAVDVLYFSGPDSNSHNYLQNMGKGMRKIGWTHNCVVECTDGTIY